MLSTVNIRHVFNLQADRMMLMTILSLLWLWPVTGAGAAAGGQGAGLGPSQLNDDMLVPSGWPPWAGGRRQHKLLRRPHQPDEPALPDALWPPGSSGWPEVPFYLSEGAGAEVREAWEHGRQHWEANTCITFREVAFPAGTRPNCSRLSQQPVVCVQGEPDGCYSDVGRQLPSPLGAAWLQPQVLNLDPEICKQTTVIHEIGHTVGLAHEMSRPAARQHLKVNFHHMRLSPNLWAQSQVCDLATSRVPYDYLSIMHYSTFAGSRDGQPVFVTRDPLRQHLVDHNDDVRFIAGLPGLSHLDRYVINTEYGCERLWAAAHCGGRITPCRNLGYMGADCRCVCPRSHLGAFCQISTQPLWPRPACVRTVTEPEEFSLSSAGMGVRHERRPESCTVLVRGATGTLARVEVHAATFLAVALANLSVPRLARDACGLGLSVLVLPGTASDGRNECVDTFVSTPEKGIHVPHRAATLHVRVHQVTTHLEPVLRQIRIRVSFVADAAAQLRVEPVNGEGRMLDALTRYHARVAEVVERVDPEAAGGATRTGERGLVTGVVLVLVVIAANR
ncbi:protein SpAN-like isoform X1 [Amphibalanus amphitrite]|uniref:protein SpAN-like isoform X1 n=2 Tax=Amphibalanus amphitrite TaxID=1232801 RepID=UPI001C914161|nr:protein SpAN-like isoform X1 [Amphibalanus amphitrite]